MANRKLDHTRSTLPGPSGKPTVLDDFAGAADSLTMTMSSIGSVLNSAFEGIANAIDNMFKTPDSRALSIEQRFGPLIDAAWAENSARDSNEEFDVPASLMDGAL